MNPEKDLAQFKALHIKNQEAEYLEFAKMYIRAGKAGHWSKLKRYTSPLTLRNVGENNIKELHVQMHHLLNKGDIEWLDWRSIEMDATYNVGYTFAFRCDGVTYYMDVYEESYNGKEQLYVLNVRDTRLPKFKE